MKKINLLFKIILCSILIFGFASCNEDAGITTKRLNGDEQYLPEELKGLKIYSVALDQGGYVKVAVLDNKINSTTYRVRKADESVIILNRQTNKLIEVKEILVENDSIIVCRK